MLMQNRLLYHQHILTRDDSETIKKIYFKQKEESCRGDWYKIIQRDFQFLGIKMDENVIINTPKLVYKKFIKSLIKKAAFEEYMQEKSSKSKLDEVTYESLKIQPYLTEYKLNTQEKNLLYSLRSRSHPAKSNYKKMYNNQLQCTFLCLENEDQKHIFEKCEKIRAQLHTIEATELSQIYKDLNQQIQAAKYFIQVEEIRCLMVQKLNQNEDPVAVDSALLQGDPLHILPGGLSART